MDIHETEGYPSDKDVRLHTREGENYKDRSYFEDSRKSLLPKKDGIHNLQKDLNRLVTENEFVATPLIVPQEGVNKRFTFNLEKDSDHSQIMNGPPMSAEGEGKTRFRTPVSVIRSRDKRLAMERLETIYTKRNRFQRPSMYSVDNRNQTLTYLERLLIATEPDSGDSDISDDDVKPQENNANTDEEEDEDDDELNNSVCFPLEADVLNIKDINKADHITEYLEERIEFLHDKLDKMKAKLTLETQYIGKKLKILRRRKLLDTLI